MILPQITSLKNLKGKRIILRLSLNVPVSRGTILNDFRLKRVLPTLDFLRVSGAKTIVVSHFDYDTKKQSGLKQVARYINRFIPLGYVPVRGKLPPHSLFENMKEGGIFLLGNIRNIVGEETNDIGFARELASYGDIFVNEDFAVSHRAHASVVGLPKYLPSFIGPVFAEEVKELEKVFQPKHPFVFILGGAKFETKLPLVKKFLPLVDQVFIVGALSNSFFKELGYNVGKSLTDSKILGLKTLANNSKIILPSDVIVVSRGKVSTKLPTLLSPNDRIVDVGPETVSEIIEATKKTKFILWNGPLGKFEAGFIKPTEQIAEAIAKTRCYSIVGGGDSVSAIEHLGLLDKFSFVSTGGGAMLEFLAKGTLPGIEAILKSRN